MDHNLDKAITEVARLTFGDEGTVSSGDSEASSEVEEGTNFKEGDSGEDLTGVDADVSKLMSAKEVYVPTMQFRKSSVSASMIKFYVDKGYFPEGVARAPGDEQVLVPKHGEAIVFKDFFNAGLRFPCDKLLHSILDRYQAKLPHLTPNAFVAFSKFYWVQRTCGGHIDVDGFVRLFKLHIQQKRVTFEGEEGIFENHFVCCTFAMRRKNEKQGIKRIELSHAQRNRWEDDWLNYWFYIKIDISDAFGINRPFYPFYAPLAQWILPQLLCLRVLK